MATNQSRGVSVFEPEVSEVIDPNKERGRIVVRDSWSGEWTTINYLEPLISVYEASPGKSNARMRYRYGEIKREDKAAFEIYPIQSLNGKYVRYDRVDDNGAEPRWYGVIDDDALEVHGTTGDPQGNQEFRCYGLEHLLDRAPIRTAKAYQDGTISLERIPVFNRRAYRGGSLLGNRSTTTKTDDVFEFSSDGAVWTAKDVIESLLAWNLPDDSPAFELAGQASVLDSIKRVWSFPAGTTLRTALNKLIDRRRGLGWCVRVGDNDQVQIWVFTVLDEPVSVGEQVVPANTEIVTYTLDDAIDINEAMVQLNHSSRFDRVVAQGNFLRSIFTVSFTDGNLEAGFTSSLLNTYKSGASGSDGYSEMNPYQKGVKSDKVRSQDRFDRLGVFRIPASWDVMSKDGEGGSSSVAIPQIYDDGTVEQDAPAPLWTFGKPLLRELPGMEVGKDYTTATPTSTNPSDAEPEMMRPLVLIKYGEDEEEGFVHLDKNTQNENFNIPNATIRMLDREMAMQIDLRPRHLLFKNHWSSAEPSYFGPNDPFDSTTAMDYEDIVATVAMESDQRVRIVAGGEAGVGREITIEVDDADLVYLAPNTVVGVDNEGALQRAPSLGTFLIDDRDRLRVIAALAWAWYSKARASVKIKRSGMYPMLYVGNLVKSVQSGTDGRDVGTVVTRETINWGKRPSVSVETQFANIGAEDFGADLPSRKSVGREIGRIKQDLDDQRKHTGGLVTRVGVASVLVAATSALLLPTAVCTLDADNPNTATAGAVFRNEGVGAGTVKKKAVFKFPTKLTGAEVRYILGLLSLDWGVQYTSGTPTAGRSITWNWLAKVINEDFDPTIATWNTPGFTEGSSIKFGSSKLHVGTHTAGLGNSIDHDNIAEDSTPVKDVWLALANGVDPLVLVSDVYGIVLSGTIEATQSGSVSSAHIEGTLTPLLGS